ncbi:MAG: HU family DNA-binding protein [Bacteroidaceae bacterium]|nr:HU family DNA-binding protein [Bacteroidaceae bacterium]
MGNPKIRLSSKKKKIGYSKKVAYVTTAKRYNTIHADELIQLCAKDCGLTDAQIAVGCRAYTQEVRQLLFNGHSVQIGNLGTFRIGFRAKAVENAEDVSTDLIRRRRVIFTPSPELREELNKVGFIVDTEIESNEVAPAPDGNG